MEDDSMSLPEGVDDEFLQRELDQEDNIDDLE